MSASTAVLWLAALLSIGNQRLLADDTPPLGERSPLVQRLEAAMAQPLPGQAGQAGQVARASYQATSRPFVVPASYQEGVLPLPPPDDARSIVEYIPPGEPGVSYAPGVTIVEAPGPLPPPGYVVASDKNFTARWDNGLLFESKHKDFTLRLGGRTQIDTGFFGESPVLRDTPIVDGGVGRINNSTEFRRARLRAEGTMWEVVGFAAEYDFSNMVNVSQVVGNPPGFPSSAQGVPGLGPLAIAPSITDLYVTVIQMPIGNFRVGNFKEPIGYEHLTSSRWLDFLERSYNQDAFYGPFNNGFMPGMMLFNWARDERSTWALWAGPNQSNIFGYHVGDQYAGTGRMTFLPYYDEPSQGRYLVHLGGSASVRRPDQHQVRFRARGDIRSGPPSTINPIYADTGSFAASAVQMLNLEAVSIWGPWTFQSEYLGTWVQDARQNGFNPLLPPAQTNLPAPSAPGNAVYFQGAYFDMLYFLTGESRPYDRRAGVVTRVIPNENFFWVRTPRGGRVGWGAFQVAARYSFLDLNSNGINGGLLNSCTLGLNWFLNPNMKFQFNYDYTARGPVGLAGAGSINSGGVRMAMDF